MPSKAGAIFMLPVKHFFLVKIAKYNSWAKFWISSKKILTVKFVTFSVRTSHFYDCLEVRTWEHYVFTYFISLCEFADILWVSFLSVFFLGFFFPTWVSWTATCPTQSPILPLFKVSNVLLGIYSLCHRFSYPLRIRW